MAGTAVDSLMAGVAGATTGIGVGAPIYGGSLSIGVTSDAPKVKTFTGQTGKLDAAGYCVAAACYDLMFIMNKAGTAVLPFLALSAVGSNTYKSWTVTLRQGVKFHSGAIFNADAVVANFQAAKADLTVGQALANVVDSCTKVSTYVVKYTTHFSYFTFPFILATSQIAFMADPVMFAPTPSNPGTYTYNGLPQGTGAFKCNSWNLNTSSSWSKNTTYWRQDALGHALPYLSTLTFKVIPDAATRLSALQSASIDIGVFFDGVTQKQIKNGVSAGGNPAVYLSDLNSVYRDPAMNCIMCNVTGKDLTGATGSQDPSGSWVPGPAAPTSDIRIRSAMSNAINRTAYLTGIDQGQGATSDGPFRTSSPFYAAHGYPAGGTPANITAARSAVNSYKSSHGIASGTPVTVHMQIVSGSSTAANQFTFIKNALTPVGINLVAVPLLQSVLIGNAIYKRYECTGWAQFGGASPDLNYVWWTAFQLSGHGTYFSGFVNFANNVDAVLENAMLAAMATSSLATRKTKWKTVNTQLTHDLPYIWLDTTVSMWAANSHVQNWAYGSAPSVTSVKSATPCLNPDGGAMGWSSIWIN